MVNNSVLKIKVSFLCVVFSLVQHEGSTCIIKLSFLLLSALKEDPKESAKLFWQRKRCWVGKELGFIQLLLEEKQRFYHK